MPTFQEESNIAQSDSHEDIYHFLILLCAEISVLNATSDVERPIDNDRDRQPHVRLGHILVKFISECITICSLKNVTRFACGYTKYF